MLVAGFVGCIWIVVSWWLVRFSDLVVFVVLCFDAWFFVVFCVLVAELFGCFVGRLGF